MGHGTADGRPHVEYGLKGLILRYFARRVPAATTVQHGAFYGELR